jgi:hypothetical protein
VGWYYTAKDSWLGATADLGAVGATYNLAMDPFEKYDTTCNGIAPVRTLSSALGEYAGQDNGWVLSLIEPVMLAFDQWIIKYPNVQRFVGAASTDLVPDLQHPDDLVRLLKNPAASDVHGGGGTCVHEARRGRLRPRPGPDKRTP